MNEPAPFLLLEQSFAGAVAWVDQQVSSVGLHLLETFNLQVARQAKEECPCPHHGTDQCDCQMGVLLVYGFQFKPISLVLHSYEGQTWLSIVDTPQQRADPVLEATVRQALTRQSLDLTDPVNCSHDSCGKIAT